MQIVAGSATVGNDFLDPGISLNWEIGETGIKTFETTILDDQLDEADETFGLSLSSVVGAQAGEPAIVTVTIVDNDSTPPPVVPPEQTRANGSGGGGSLSLTALFACLWLLAIRCRSLAKMAASF